MPEVPKPKVAAPRHVPVLLENVIELLGPALQKGGWWVDGTVGLGGHSAAILERFPQTQLVAIDRDPNALRWAKERLAPFGPRAVFVNAPFSRLKESLHELEIDTIRGLFADLGVSSMQLDEGARGFSFQQDAPLDMRMGAALTASGLEESDRDSWTAKDIVNRYPEEDLANILRKYGEERHAKRIARGLVAARAEAPIETTGQLARLVERLKPERPRHRPGQRRLHPATQVFQALRIEVNQELDELHELLDQAVNLLEQEGRLAIISYHSLEDRIVKHTLRDLATGEIEPITGRPRAETQVIEVLTKKPLRPGESEISSNPRARSARLRAARRL